MKRILFITNIPSPYRLDLYSYIQNNIHEYEFYVIYSANSVENREWDIDNDKFKNTYFLKTKVLPIKKKYDSRHIFFPVDLYSRLSEINPDAVVVWEYGPVALKTLFWSKLKRRKFIHLTDGTIYSERNINYIQKLSRKIIIKNCDAAIASSTMSIQKLVKWGMDRDKIFLSLLTVNILPFEKLVKATKKGRILFVGSFIERKGLDLLFNALELVECDYELHIVGNGTSDEIEYINKRISSCSLRNKVTIVGYKQGDALLKEYSEANLFVFPTREDCFGLVLVEALCSKVPIITSKYADGAYDIVEEYKNGLIVNPYDANEFSRAIRDVLMDKIVLDDFSEKIIDRFRFENVIDGYLQAVNYVFGQ